MIYDTQMEPAVQRDSSDTSKQTPELHEATLADQMALWKKTSAEPCAAGSSLKGSDGTVHAASQVLKNISSTL